MVRFRFFLMVLGSVFLMQGCVFDTQPDMDDIVQKIVKVETANADYTAVNPKTGAYGKYQIKPSVAKYYTQKLGIPYANWKTPHNQDKIFRALLADNIRCLRSNGHEINAFTVYGAHQQGATGFDNIVKNRPLSDETYARLRRNVPAEYRDCEDSELCNVWVCYWKKKLS
jgi:hypothetical protein